MKTKKYNIRGEDLLHSMEKFITHNVDNRAVITTIFTKDNTGEWKYLIGKCEFTSLTKLKEIEEWYSDAVFIRKFINDFNLEKTLDSLLDGGFVISNRLPRLVVDSNHINWSEQIVPSHATSSECPERKYSAKLSEATHFVDEGLLGYGTGFRSSSRQYVKDFMGLSIYHGQSHADNGAFSIYIPDHRGKIVINDGSVSIEGNEADICLVGESPDHGVINIKRMEKIELSERCLKKSELWLITEENEILDFLSTSDFEYRHSPSDDESDKRDRILALIDGGEGHETEFKKHIELTPNKSSKAADIEKTVCALSNAKGGDLLIGVDDNACPVGVDDQVRKNYKVSLDEALGSYMKDIEKRLQEKLRYNQCFDISQIKIGEKHIVVVSVRRTEEPNFYLNDGTGFIRKGATSAKMKASDEREKIPPTLSSIDMY